MDLALAVIKGELSTTMTSPCGIMCARPVGFGVAALEALILDGSFM